MPFSVEVFVHEFICSYAPLHCDWERSTGFVGDPKMVQEFTDIVTRHTGKTRMYRILGRGSFGLAGDIGGRQVLKLTIDQTEVAAADMVMGRDIPNVVEIYKAGFVDITMKGRHKGVLSLIKPGLIVMEKLDRMGLQNTDAEDLLDSIVEVIRGRFKRKYRGFGHEAKKGAALDIERELRKEGEKRNIRAFFDIAQGVGDLASIGAYITDPHAGNVGYSKRDRRYKIFDLGLASSPPDREPVTFREA